MDSLSVNLRARMNDIFPQGRPRLPFPHRHHQHGLALDVVRHHLLSRHHRLQHELHAEIRP